MYIGHKRRHGNTSYLPFPISVRKLVERVKKSKPNINVLSTKKISLQFSSHKLFRKSALTYTARFDFKYKAQRRQIRSEHVDSSYTFVYYSYFK